MITDYKTTDIFCAEDDFRKENKSRWIISLFRPSALSFTATARSPSPTAKYRPF